MSSSFNRIAIIGCCGSGKSTLARNIHQKTRLPLIHLDQYFHLPNWQEPSREDWAHIVTGLADKDQWIMDGNYGGTMDIRLARADTMIFMNFPSIQCLSRVIKRTWKHHGQVRPDMPKGCPERFDLKFLHYVAMYNKTRRAGILEKMEKFKGTKIIISSDIEAAEFVNRLG